MFRKGTNGRSVFPTPEGKKRENKATGGARGRQGKLNGAVLSVIASETPGPFLRTLSLASSNQANAVDDLVEVVSLSVPEVTLVPPLPGVPLVPSVPLCSKVFQSVPSVPPCSLVFLLFLLFLLSSACSPSELGNTQERAALTCSHLFDFSIR